MTAGPVAVRLGDGSWYGLTTDAGRFGSRTRVGTYPTRGGASVLGPVAAPGDRFGSVTDAETVAVIAGRSARLWSMVYRSTTGPARSRADQVRSRFARDRSAAVRYLQAAGASVPADD